MKILIKNANLITPLENGDISASKKDIYINDGIVNFSKTFDKADKIIDAKEKVVLPGLVISHHHIYSTLSKGIPCDVPFKNFLGNLKQLWWLLDKSLDKDSTILSTVLTMQDAIKWGVTTIFDHHISGYVENSLEHMGKVFEDYKINGALCFETTNRNGNEFFEECVAENYRFAKKNKNSKLLKGLIGLHALLTLNDENLKYIAQETEDFPIHCHVAEGIEDEDFSLRDYKKSVIERLEQAELLRKNSLIVHVSNVSEKELDILAKKDLFIAQACDSNMNNGLNLANFHKLLDKNLKITAGTDGMHSSALKAMKNSYEFVKYTNRNCDLGFPEMIAMFNNAYKLKQSYGFPLGCKENEKADLVIFDYTPATLFDKDTFFGHFIFGITESRAQYVLKEDEVLLDNFELNENLNKPYQDLIKDSLNISNKMFERFVSLKAKCKYENIK